MLRPIHIPEVTVRGGGHLRKISLIALLVLCAPFVARAAGGPCPSGANYFNPNNPSVGVTLSSMGVTNCFYIAANGADSNSGASEQSPWQHAPGMPNCTSVCASTTPTAGEGFIFRGGDTWHYGGGSPAVGGEWNWKWTGNSSNRIYIGVDQNWSAGGSWTRPILNGDNPVVAGGIVSSCAFPMANTDFVRINGVLYVTFDNFEFTGMCWNDVPNNSNVHDYLQHFGVGPSYATSFRTISNNYFHGWTHVAFNCNGGNGPVCGGAVAIRGDTHLEAGTQIVSNVIDGADSDDLTMNAVDGDGYIAAYNVIRHVGGTSILDNCHSLHDNLFEYVNNVQDGDTHSDLWFCIGEAPSNNYFYNNTFRYIGTLYNQPLSTIMWFNAQPGFTDYIFNNVGHDVNCSGNCNNFENPSGMAFAQIFNNTWQANNTTVWKNGNSTNYTITTANNHYITPQGTNCAAVFDKTTTVNGGNSSCSGDVFQTLAAAKAQGYTSANDFAPTTTSTATVGTGANEFGLGNLFGAAFLSSTTDSCIYNTSNHSVSCPAVNVSARLSIGSWDSGAYWSGNASSNQPPAPSGLTATVTN